MPARPDFGVRLAAERAQRQQAGLWRRLRTASSSRSGRIVLAGRELIDFGSNDYLGLAQHPQLIEALQRAASVGVGARASHLLGGHRDEHAALEQDVAQWLGRERALLFSCGYMAALGVTGTLLRRHDLCLQDRLNHACLLDGARLSGATLQRYRHGDVNEAQRLLRQSTERAALLVSDSVFSMDGDLAPLPELADLARREGACLMLDEAHALGALGPRGAGACAAAGLGAADVPVWMGTLGKALGGTGAVIAGSAELIEALVNSARSYVYTTAMPPALASAMRVAVQLAQEADDRRAHLQQLIAQLQQGAASQGWTLLPSTTPIQPLLVGSAERASALAAALEQAGCYCPAIRPPTVPTGSARLRISLSAAHSVEDVGVLLGALGQQR